MLTVSDAADEFQFAASLFSTGLLTTGRVLAALSGVSTAVSGELAFPASS